jgi:hypothetical protein
MPRSFHMSVHNLPTITTCLGCRRKFRHNSGPQLCNDCVAKPQQNGKTTIPDLTGVDEFEFLHGMGARPAAWQVELGRISTRIYGSDLDVDDIGAM